MASTHRIKRIIEFSGMPGTGKTTLCNALTANAPDDVRIGHRPRFKSLAGRPAYYALMAGHPVLWLGLYRVLRRALSRREARRRTRMYIKHLWRRRTQLRARRVGLIVEDEAFATWFARDLERCPGFEAWLDTHAGYFYPGQAGRYAAEYVLVHVSCDEAERVRRLRARRLRRGEAYALAEEERDGSHASRHPAVDQVTRMLSQRRTVNLVATPREQERLLRDPLAQ